MPTTQGQVNMPGMPAAEPAPATQATPDQATQAMPDQGAAAMPAWPGPADTSTASSSAAAPGANIGVRAAQCNCAERIGELEMQVMVLTSRLVKMEEWFYDWD